MVLLKMRTEDNCIYISTFPPKARNTQKAPGFAFLRSLRLSELPSLGQKPLQVRRRHPFLLAFSAALDGYENQIPSPSATEFGIAHCKSPVRKNHVESTG
jgi:hypothetical protein